MAFDGIICEPRPKLFRMMLSLTDTSSTVQATPLKIRRPKGKPSISDKMFQVTARSEQLFLCRLRRTGGAWWIDAYPWRSQHYGR